MSSDQISRLGKSALIYGFGSVSVQLVIFFLLPIYTRYLAPAEFGIFDIVKTTSSLLSLILLMGLSSALFKSYYTVDDSDTREKFISTAFMSVTSISAVIVLLLVTMAPSISSLIFGTSANAGYLRMIFLTLFFEVGIILFMSVLRAKEKAKQYTLLALLRTVLLMGLSVLLVVGFELRLFGVMLALLLSAFLVYLYALSNIWQSLSHGFSLPELKRMLNYGLPLVPAGVAGMILSVSNRYIIQALLGSSEVGVYGLGYRLGMVMQVLIIGPFTIAWGPFLWSINKKPDAKRIYSEVLNYFLLVAMFVSLGISLFSVQIVQLISTPEYFAAHTIIPFVTIAYVFHGMYYIFSPGINLKSKTKFLPLIVGASAILNIALNLLWIPKFGIVGAAYATTIAYLTLPISTFFISRHYYEIQYQWVQVIKIFVVYAVGLLVADQVQSEIPLINILIRSLIVLGFPITLYIIRYIRREEILDLLRNFRSK